MIIRNNYIDIREDNDKVSSLISLLRDHKLINITKLLVIRYRGNNYIVKCSDKDMSKLDKLDLKVITDAKYAHCETDKDIHKTSMKSMGMSRQVMYVASNIIELNI